MPIRMQPAPQAPAMAPAPAATRPRTQPEAPAAADSGDVAIDLSQESAVSASSSLKNPHSGGGTAMPNLKVLFDFNLTSRPGISDLSFENYHAFLFFEIVPNDRLQFSFDVSPAPQYYELDWQASPKLQFRLGKIWIPFDDLSPHNLFGGRINVSKLEPSANGTARFLPNLWTDLGVGAKIKLMDTPRFSAEGHVYLVNGFGDGGKDPSPVTNLGSTYPSFADTGISSRDNNRNKAVGARLSILGLNTVGLGTSFYTGRWTDEASEVQSITMLGFDGQLRFPSSEFRVGLVTMNIGLPGEARFTRGGYYGEFGYKFGGDKRWKFLARGGAVQLDSRVRDVTDQDIVGGAILYQPAMIQYSLEHSRDLNTSISKENQSYTNLRVVIAL